MVSVDLLELLCRASVQCSFARCGDFVPFARRVGLGFGDFACWPRVSAPQDGLQIRQKLFVCYGGGPHTNPVVVMTSCGNGGSVLGNSEECEGRLDSNWVTPNFSAASEFRDWRLCRADARHPLLGDSTQRDIHLTDLRRVF